jgi:UrcA family protein
MTRQSSSRAPVRAQVRIAAAAGCLFAIAMSGSGAVLADDAPPAVRVNYAGLDLTTERGAQMLYERINAAAERVCPSADSRDLLTTLNGRICRKHAVEQAIAQVGNPKLAALLAQHTSRS